RLVDAIDIIPFTYQILTMTPIRLIAYCNSYHDPYNRYRGTKRKINGVVPTPHDS
ncbi:hypothetical protein HAX54_051361, partial [Datura stramonium]|nr:hypothetical protein [Datura stramonium]